MEQSLTLGRYRARLASTSEDRAAALALRGAVFRRGRAPDADRFDDLCAHMMVEEAASGALVSTFRMLALPSGAMIHQSYAAQHYDLCALESFETPIMEIGRFCIADGCRNPDVLRAAWGALTVRVERSGIAFLFGCSSFPGTDPAPHSAAFSLLAARHLAPDSLRPKRHGQEVYPFAEAHRGQTPDLKAAMKAMPPLLRSYLAMGGWVSDHAVVDRDLGTLHVFTGLEIAAIPEPRKRLLRAVAAQVATQDDGTALH